MGERIPYRHFGIRAAQGDVMSLRINGNLVDEIVAESNGLQSSSINVAMSGASMKSLCPVIRRFWCAM